jgi:hypothetical protein
MSCNGLGQIFRRLVVRVKREGVVTLWTRNLQHADVCKVTGEELLLTQLSL